MSRARKIALIVLAALLALPPLAVASLALLYESEGGRRWIASQLESALSEPGETAVALEGLGGSLFDGITLARLVVSDRSGTWLEGERLALAWSPWALLSGRLEIEALGAKRIALRRLPRSSAPAEPASGMALPRPPLPVSLGRLDIARLELGGPVLGVPAALAIEGRAEAPGDGGADARFSLRRLDGAAGRAELRARISSDDGSLDLSITVEEPKGGLLVRALEVPGLPAVAIEIAGSGPLSSWKGKARLALDGAPQLEAALTLDAGGPYRLTSEGWLAGEALLPPELTPLAAPRLDFALTAALDEAGEQVSIERFALSSDAGSVNARGALDLARGETALTVSGTLQGAAFATLTDPVAFAAADFDGEISGALATPQISLDARLRDARLPEFAFAEARLRLTAAPEGADWRLQARLDETDASYGQPILSDLLGAAPEVALAGLYRSDDGILAVESLDISGTAMTARGRGEFAPSGAATLSLAAELRDLAALAGVSGLDLAGAGHIDAEIESADLANGMTVAATATTDNFALGIAALDPLIGSRPKLSARLAFEDWRALTVDEAKLDGAALAAAGSARLADDFETLSADYRVILPDLAPLDAATGLALAGSAILEGTAKGALADPALEGRLAVEDLALDARPLGRLSGRYSIAGLAAPRGDLSLALDSPEGPLAVASRFAVDEAFARLTLDDLTLSSGGNALAGTLAVPLDGAPMSGDISGNLEELAPLGALAALDLRGSAAVTLSLAARGGKQAASLRLDGKQLALLQNGDRIVAERLTASADLSDLLGSPRGSMRIDAARVSGAGVDLASLAAGAEGDLAALDFDVQAKGTAGLPFDLTAAGSAAWSAPRFELTLARLDGRLAEEPIALTRPLTVVYGEDRLQAEPLALTWAGGSIDGSLALDPEAVTLRLAAERLPLALAALFVPDLKLDGRLKLAIALNGPPAAPEGTAHLEIADLTMPGLAAEFPPLQGSADATLAGGRLNAKGALGGLEETALDFALALPVSASAAPFSLAVAENAPLDGSASLKGRIAPLWQTLGIDLHRLDGQLAADLALGGTLAAPRVTGDAQISQGSYENFETGTLLKNLELEAVAEGRRLTIERLSASDGGDGRLTGSGEIAFVPERDFPLSFAVTLVKATLVRRDDVTATMSGEITLDGTLAALALGGKLTSDTIEARLVNKLPPEVVTLPVEVAGAEQSRQKEDESGGTRIALDLLLDLPQRVFLRGRGLDSEWGGKLAVTGTAAAPKIDGQLKPIRGQFDFAGKVFKLGEGSVDFAGAEIDPRLDLSANHQAQEILAIVRVTGRASAPKIGFESRPPYPEEEILARVLFGKSRGKLSAGEAVQLASTLRALTGSGEAGILDTARQTLGVDVLRLTGGGEGAQAGVAVGKYLSDQVYVGVEQGAAAGQTNATVEVEITPSITLEGDVGANSGSRVGAKWRWDY